MENCPFCNVLPEHILAENESALVIPNLFPATMGHLLVITRDHIAEMSQLTPEQWIDLAGLVKEAGDILKEKLKPAGLNVFHNEGLVAGQTIKHLHVHLVPREPNDGLLNFRRTSENRMPAGSAELENLKKFFK